MRDLSQATRPTRAASRSDAGEVQGVSRIEVPSVPDPQRDVHVAFPDHDNPGHRGAGAAAPSGGSPLPHRLPGSAWAGPSERPKRSLLETPPAYPGRTRVPRKLASALAAAVLLGALMIGAANRSAIGEVTAAGLDSDQQYAATVADGGFVDDGDQIVAAMPSTFTKLRLELAGKGDAQLEVTSSRVTYEQPVTLPLRRNVSGQAARGDSFGVVVTGAGPDERVQCRLYADDRLVKIVTGEGRADCTVLVP